jgi:hypothetical protein
VKLQSGYEARPCPARHGSGPWLFEKALTLRKREPRRSYEVLHRNTKFLRFRATPGPSSGSLEEKG